MRPPYSRLRLLCLAALLPLAVTCSSGGLASGGTTSAPSAHVPGILLSPGRRPEPVLVDAPSHRVYIGTETGSSIVVLDDRTNRIVKTVRVGREVEDLALDASAGRLYAACNVASVVTVLNARTMQVTATLRNMQNPYGLALDTRAHRLFVSEAGGHAVVAVDTNRMSIVRKIPLPGRPEGIGVDPTVGRLFVGLLKRRQVEVISEGSGKVVGHIEVGALPLHPFRVDSTTHRLYVLSAGSSTISVIDTRSLRVVRILKTAPHPEGFDVHTEIGKLYVSNEGDPGTDRNSGHTASVVDLRTGRIVDTIRTLVGPDGIGYDPNNGSIYISDEDQGREQIVKLPITDR